MARNGCSQSGDKVLKLTVSEEWTDGIIWFFTYLYRFTKIKADKKLLGWAWSKMGLASLVTGF